MFKKLRPNLAILAFTGAFLFPSCHERLSVETQYFTNEDLASFYVDTPDPLINNPPAEQRLMIAWNLNHCYKNEKKTLKIYIRLKNREKIEQLIPLNSLAGTHIFTLCKDQFFATGGFLTYKVEIIVNGAVVETFYHQLWTELIEFEKRVPMP